MMNTNRLKYLNRFLGCDGAPSLHPGGASSPDFRLFPELLEPVGIPVLEPAFGNTGAEIKRSIGDC